METLPGDVCLNIFRFLDHQNLAAAQQVCRKWKVLASDNILWSKLFKERWGDDQAMFFTPTGSKSWKDVYETQDRCDRVGLGLKIIREGGDYFLIHQGEIRRYLGSRKRKSVNDLPSSSKPKLMPDGSLAEESCRGILDKILFFIGDLEVATAGAKRGRSS
ncbi:hypothetical protein SLE2022_287720 [Rubroshorea leprosula]